MKSHTPGPWSVLQHEEGDIVILDKTRGTLAEIFAVNDTRDQETPQANARLIAAAPEILDALNMFITDCQDCRLSGPDWSELRSTVIHARSLIAKVKGDI